MAKARTRSGGTGGQADAPAPNPPGRPPPATNLAGKAPAAATRAVQLQGTSDESASRPVREAAPDRVALLAAGVVLAAIALAAWLALFRVH